MELENKVALVTGSAHRVGKELAHAVAEQGCRVVIHYNRSAEKAHTTLQSLRNMNVEAIALQADLTNLKEIDDLFKRIDKALGPIDILVNSAAILQPIDLLDVNESDWDGTINLNMKAAFFCLQQAAVRMKSSSGGVIINISDIIGHKPHARFPIHSVSKAGLEMITKIAAIALAPEIRVNAIAPGPVLRPEGLSIERWDNYSKKALLNMRDGANQLSDALLFLLKNDYITGEILVIDGGMSLVE